MGAAACAERVAHARACSATAACPAPRTAGVPSLKLSNARCALLGHSAAASALLAPPFSSVGVSSWGRSRQAWPRPVRGGLHVFPGPAETAACATRAAHLAGRERRGHRHGEEGAQARLLLARRLAIGAARGAWRGTTAQPRRAAGPGAVAPAALHGAPLLLALLGLGAVLRAAICLTAGPAGAPN